MAGILLAALVAAPAQAARADVPEGYACAVTYASVGWTTGFTATLTITNTGTLAFSPWILQLVWPGNQTLYQGWNATFSHTPPSLQAASPAWKPSIDPDTTFWAGFVANGADERPTGVTLNGVPCTVTYETTE